MPVSTRARRRRRCHCALVAMMALVAGACTGGTSHAAHAPTPSLASSTTSGPRPSAPSTTKPKPSAGGQQLEPALPIAIQEAAAASTGDHLYVVGGYDSARNSRATTFVFDGTTWRPGPALPIAVNHPGAAALAGAVYVAGGFTPSGATDRAFVLAAGSNRWRELAAMRRPRGALALVAIAGRLYAIGGRDGGVQVAVPEVYDPASGRWSDLPAMPAPRNHVAGYVDGVRACVAGGRTPLSSAEVDCFDTPTATWRNTATLPTATSGAAAAVLDGATIVAGGEPADESHLVGVVQTLRQGVWTATPMLVPRHGTAFAIYQGRLWACGGAIAPGFRAVNTCTALVP